MNVPWRKLHDGYLAEVGDLSFCIFPTGARTCHWLVKVRLELKGDEPKWQSQVTLEAYDDCSSVKRAKFAAEQAGGYIQAAYDGMKGVK